MLELGEIVAGEGVQIGQAADEPAVEKLRYDGFAEALDIHHAAGSEVEQALAQARGAVDVDAAIVGFALGADHFAVALRAMRREVKGAAAAWMLLVVDHLDDFGNDVAAAFHFHKVADLEAEALDLVGVVQRGAAYVVPPMETGVSTATGVSFPRDRRSRHCHLPLGVNPGDPLTLISMGLAGGRFAARLSSPRTSAMRINPLIALKYE